MILDKGKEFYCMYLAEAGSGTNQDSFLVRKNFIPKRYNDRSMNVTKHIHFVPGTIKCAGHSAHTAWGIAENLTLFIHPIICCN
jgi:hypothetical protein